MQKIVPYLWLKTAAEEAARFYTSLFPNSRVHGLARFTEAGPGPQGAVMTVPFQLAGQQFAAMNNGPVRMFTPATSFYVRCKTTEEVDALWARLSEGGTVIMELDKYPFSDQYGWLEDRYGVSWQLIRSANPFAQKILTCLAFSGLQTGKAEAAIRDYTAVFGNSQVLKLERYPAGAPGPEGLVMHAEFKLEGQEFVAMDSHLRSSETFTHAISLLVNCQSQEEIDRLWERLSAGGNREQSGWLQDKYGLSWQIVPAFLEGMMMDPDAQKSRRIMEAMLRMSKLEIGPLKAAYEGRIGVPAR